MTDDPRITSFDRDPEEFPDRSRKQERDENGRPLAPMPRYFLLHISIVIGGIVLWLVVLSVLFGSLPRSVFGIPVMVLVLIFYGWMLFTFLHYRQARQEEVLQLLAAAVEARVPLAPALRTYLEERPVDSPTAAASIVSCVATPGTACSA